MKRILKAGLLILGLALSTAIIYAETWDANITLHGPDFSYEGHRIEIIDTSLFHLGSSSDTRSFRMIEEASNLGYVSTSWTGDYQVLSTTSSAAGAIICRSIKYEEPGVHEINLVATWLAGGLAGTSESCTKSIEIKACPCLDEVSFGGSHRAYQRQEISLKIAQNPSYPIDLSSVKISILDSDGNAIPWCRDIVTELDDAGEFLLCSMEFLTKNSADENFTYRVQALDSRGKSLDTSGSFTVARDKAPQASIEMKLSFYRSAGGGPATITAKYNGSYTDDQVAVEWSLPSSAKNCTYSGIGFDSAVSFELADVGRYRIGLTAKDLWGDTLDEFVSDSERKSASCTVNFKVDNKAPTLGEVSSTKSLEMLLINGSLEAAEELRTDFEELNIAASLYLMDADTSAAAGVYNAAINYPVSTSAYVDNNEIWEKMIICDDKYSFKFYSCNATTSLASGPYYIQRCRLDGGGETIFSYDQSLFGTIPRATSMKMGYDLQEKYLYVIIGSTTHLIDKESGAHLLTVSKALSSCNTVYGDYFYSFCSDGIYKVRLSDGMYENMYSCECITDDCQSARLKYGNMYFAAKKDGAVYLGCFKAATETVSMKKLYDSVGTDYILAITPTVNLYMTSNSGGKANVSAWDINGNQIGSSLNISLCTYFVNYPVYAGVFPVFDSAGEVNFVYSPSAAMLNRAITISLYKIADGTVITSGTGTTATAKGSNLYTDLRKCNLAIERADGTVIIFSGATYSSSLKKSYCNYYSFKTGSNAMSSVTALYKYCEWGYHWNEHWVSESNLSGSGATYIYSFSEGYENAVRRGEYEILPGVSDYRYSASSTDANAAAIASALGISTGNTGSTGFTAPVLKYKVGETVSCADFGLGTGLFEDYENDLPLSEYNSLGLPRSFSQPGTYNFYYRVKDNCGNSSFDKYSKKIYCSFIVTNADGTGGSDDEGGGSGDGGGSGESGGSGGSEGEEKEPTSGSKKFVLHRKF